MSAGVKHKGARPQRVPLESEIQQQCADLLALDGWRALRTDPCSDRGRAKGFGEKGMADLLFLRPALYVCDNSFGRSGAFPKHSICSAADGQILWVEFKRPGQMPKSHQYDWHFAERLSGFLTVMAGVDFEASFEGFRIWYLVSGLLRRDGL